MGSIRPFEIIDGNVCTSPRQRHRDSSADASTGSGDESCSVCQIVHGVIVGPWSCWEYDISLPIRAVALGVGMLRLRRSSASLHSGTAQHDNDTGGTRKAADFRNRASER